MRVPRSVRVSWSFWSWVNMMSPLFGLGSGCANDGRPALELRSHECGELLSIEVAGLDGFQSKLLANVGQLQDAPHFRVQAIHDLGLHACRAGEREPDGSGQLRIPQLGESRNVGEFRNALCRAHGEGARP